MAFRQKLESDYFNARTVGSVIKMVSGELTTTGTLTVWTPATGKKVRILGWHVQAAVSVILAASAGITATFVDNAYATALGPTLFSFGATQAAGTVARSDSTELFARQGWTSATANNVLKIAHSGDISTGKIIYSVTVWGREV